IRGIATDEPTYETMTGVVTRIGKTYSSAEDFPAFIVNRILVPMINEAVYTLYEGVGTVESIDTSMKLGAVSSISTQLARNARCRGAPVLEEAIAWTAEEFVLARSVRVRGEEGASYEVVDRWPLGG
ncbi:MAG: hypothetical protein DI596_04550, partial [Azospira oryzae]